MKAKNKKVPHFITTFPPVVIWCQHRPMPPSPSVPPKKWPPQWPPSRLPPQKGAPSGPLKKKHHGQHRTKDTTFLVKIDSFVPLISILSLKWFNVQTQGDKWGNQAFLLFLQKKKTIIWCKLLFFFCPKITKVITACLNNRYTITFKAFGATKHWKSLKKTNFTLSVFHHSCLFWTQKKNFFQKKKPFFDLKKSRPKRKCACRLCANNSSSNFTI